MYQSVRGAYPGQGPLQKEYRLGTSSHDPNRERSRNWNNSFQQNGLTVSLSSSYDEVLQASSTEVKHSHPRMCQHPGGRLPTVRAFRAHPENTPTPRSEATEHRLRQTRQASVLTILGASALPLSTAPHHPRRPHPSTSLLERADREEAREEPRMSQCQGPTRTPSPNPQVFPALGTQAVE